MDDLGRLAQLIGNKNAIDREIADIIGRPALIGHVGEHIAAKIFGIKLERSASSKAIDGRFVGGDLAGKTVNVKWYAKLEGLLDITPDTPPDYYLVLTGPRQSPASSRGTLRPWLIRSVFLFDAAALLKDLRSRGVKLGIATSVAREFWDRAEVQPVQRNSDLTLSEKQRKVLEPFTSPKEGVAHGPVSRPVSLRGSAISIGTQTKSRQAVLAHNCFIGLDMVDGSRPEPRPADLAFMDRSLICEFDLWEFDPTGKGLLPNQLRPPGFVLAIDGPQGLAGSPGDTMRKAERVGGIAGKSPYDFPPRGSPYSGFVTSSIRLFAALWRTGKFHLHGLPPTANHEATLIEVYPGTAWHKLARLSKMDPRNLKRKTVREGREQRLRILERNGVRVVLGRLPNHDQLDAALAALTAARFAEGKTTEEGTRPFWDESQHVLREGLISYPC